MPKEGSNAWYRAFADRFYLDKANKDLYLYRSSASKLGLNAGLVIPDLETLDGVDLSVHAADLAAHTKDIFEVRRTGYYFYPWMHTSTLNVPIMVANKLYGMFFLVARAITIDRLAIKVTTLADGKSVRVGIYNNGVNVYPGTLLKDAGTVSVATTGLKEIILDPVLALPKGLYWLAIVSDGTPALQGGALTHSPIGNLPSTGIDQYQRWEVNFTYAALPDPFTAGGVGQPYDFPFFVLPRLYSLD